MHPTQLLRLLAVLKEHASTPGSHTPVMHTSISDFFEHGANLFHPEIRDLLLDPSRDPAEESAFFRA